MDHLLALMLAYTLVSVGSVLLSMRTNIGYLFGLMSLLYLFIAIGLVLFLISLIQGMPKPLSQDFFSQGGETKPFSERHEEGLASSSWLRFVSPDVLADYVMSGDPRKGKLEVAQREVVSSGQTTDINKVGGLHQFHTLNEKARHL